MSEYHDQERFSDRYNGVLGYWRVSGMVDEKVVRASSAQQAIASSGIPDWQNPTAKFVGKRPPDPKA